jgi:hypothetical protein
MSNVPTLSLPPLGAIQDKSVVSALQAVANWSRAAGQVYVTRDEINVPQSRLAQSVRTVVTREVSRQVDTRMVAQRRELVQTPAAIVRSILQNSGDVPALEMNSPVVFRAGTSSTNVWIGAGGMGGLAAGEVTWGVSSADGSFFFGKAMPTGDTERRQIIFDAAGGTFQFGSEIVVQRSGGNMTLDDIATAATSGGYSDSDVQDFLNTGVADILAGVGSNYRMDVDTTSSRIILSHKDINYAGYSSVADSTNTRLPGLAITSAGIAMGFNDIDGNWKNAVVLEADGDFAFGHTSGKQILWDATAGELVLGSSVRVTSTGGTTMSTIESNASLGASAYSGLSNKLNKSAADIISGVLDVDTSTYNGGIRTGSVTWNTTTGAITGGSGVVITKKGLIGVASGVTKFSIDGSTGAATFAGDISGASGTFAGSLSSSGYVYASGYNGTYSTTVNIAGTSATFYGSVFGTNSSGSSYRAGVIGVASGAGAVHAGVVGTASSNDGVGVIGHCAGTYGNGVYGYANATGSDGVFGYFGSSGATGGSGVYGMSASSACPGVVAYNSAGGTALQVSGPMTISSTALVSNLNADRLDSYHAGNSSGYIPISNGTVNTNLNADMLDGYHAGSFALASHQHSRLIHDTGTPHTYAFAEGGNTGSATANWVGLFPGTTTRNPVWVKFYIDATAFWIPLWQH